MFTEQDRIDMSPASARRRAPKAVSPSVSNQARRSPRLANDGFKATSILDKVVGAKLPQVSKAKPPLILQISELQRLGIEDCHIDPAELTEEQLLKSRVD